MLTVWQKLASIFFPVRVRRNNTVENGYMAVYYYQRRYVLGVADAIYSDGVKYRPLLAAFKSRLLHHKLAFARQVLVLGTGLASAVHILHKMDLHPSCTLVDIDRQILDWAEEFLPEAAKPDTTLVQADAISFIETTLSIYDLIIVDVFVGRVVPAGIVNAEFMQSCKNRLSKQGCLVLNYMAINDKKDDGAREVLQDVFKDIDEIAFGLNRVYVATA